MTPKPTLSFSQIINMNVGFFGIQYSFGLQQSAVNPIYDFLGASPEEIPWLNAAGPVTGLLVQPIIGALSDKTWSPRFGRRKPYFFIGAILCSICLFFYPFSSSLWMAAGLLWILDVGNNTAMEPYRAFIADKLNDDQRATGFQTQSFFTGLGQTLANLSLFVFPLIIIGKTGAIPNWVFASFFLGSVCSIGTIWWSMRTTPEIPPTENELKQMRSEPFSIWLPFKEVPQAIMAMPKVMWQLGLVYMFQWYALFCYWQNSSKSIALSVWKTNPAENPTLYEEAVSWTGLVNGWYNIVTFLSAFALVWLVKKTSPKIVHFCCLVLAGVGFIAFSTIENKYLLFPAITGFGIGWASMMGIPYLLVVGEIPKARYGVYMGIINMMIVIPMLLQTATFGYILKNYLGNNSSNAVMFAGVLLLIAAAATLLIKTKPTDNVELTSNSSH
ncbi:MAG: MFS transporter [Bacteroidota bacterium]|jgi:maltose/moltooligosaccharide transporter|nr:MFS transporter [Cytophagales bacterium]MCE2958124.1 MFS transporter [Flammeovirgaceae bacterium]MCZ8068949.1 MFS transporter [Cytophagales bacterium]